MNLSTDDKPWSRILAAWNQLRRRFAWTAKDIANLLVERVILANPLGELLLVSEALGVSAATLFRLHIILSRL